MLSRRDALTASERADASAVIARRAATAVVEAGVVALYAAKGSEVATKQVDEAVRARGGRVVYPRIVEGRRALAFHEARIDELVVGRFGIAEPSMTAPAIAVDEIDAFVVPGVAFGRDGMRLGWGRGYYDATLAAAPHALRVGLAFECQLVDEIAHESHDIAMNTIVTEVATYVVA